MPNTDQTQLTNLVNIFININLTVVLNLFLYSASASLGVLTANKVVEAIVRHFRFRADSSYKTRHDEVVELNKKMHDRLVDFEEAIRLGSGPKDSVCTRLQYNASRLFKYDKTILNDTHNLIYTWKLSLYVMKNNILNRVDYNRTCDKLLDLCKKIRCKVDKIRV